MTTGGGKHAADIGFGHGTAGEIDRCDETFAAEATARHRHHDGFELHTGSAFSMVDSLANHLLRFDQVVTPTPRSIEVRTMDGVLVSRQARQGRVRRIVEAPLRPGLGRGGYTVRWQVISADGHVGSGVFTFGLGVEAPPPKRSRRAPRRKT